MLKSCSLALLTFMSCNILAAPPVIYGDDHRQEVFEASPFHQSLAASTATMIENVKMTRSSDKPGLVQIDQTTLRSWLESQFGGEKSKLSTATAKIALDQKISFCESERFTEQPNAGVCSGFLIGPDLLVTAGHCVIVENFCQNYQWVFDFQVDPVTGSAGVDFKDENVYGCKKVISSALADSVGLDYGLVQLDRKVKGRSPLKLRTDGKVEDGGELVVIGSPSGLPLKVAAGANVRQNTHPFYFSANLDTFQGNSGSAVFDAQTGVVEGILVRGEEDFVANMNLMCIEAKRCADSTCLGEDVSRMTSIPEIAVKDALFGLAEVGNVDELEKLTTNRFWIDIYGADGRSALMKAALQNHDAFVKKLLEKGADVKLKEVQGDTVLHLLAPFIQDKNNETLKLILAAKADLEEKNDLQETALLTAARALNLQAVLILIEYGADLNAVNGLGENALVPFARSGDMKAVEQLRNLGVSDESLKESK